MTETVNSCGDARNRSTSPSPMPGASQRLEKMQGHWVLARAGKRVLRPGGLALTRRMIGALSISVDDRVIEFAPGMGVTARMVLRNKPSQYWGVERDPAAAARLESLLPKGTEARRLLAVGGRYGIHEICFRPDDISLQKRREIEAEMSKEIHVGVQPLTRLEWRELFEKNGLKVLWCAEAELELLEPRRMLQDEGIVRCLRIALNVAKDSTLRQRIFAIRGIFRKYREHLGAISIVGLRTERTA